MNDKPREVYEPEVIPPGEDVGPGPAANDRRWGQWKRSFGPIVIGLLIDVIDLATFGPLGLRNGFLLGAVAAYVLCSMYDLPMRYRILLALGAGAYCTVPFTERLPAGTIIGLITRMRAR